MDWETLSIIIFSLIVIIFGLVPSYFYIKNYDKNMQKYKDKLGKI